jgi:hypothetical protein
MSLPRIVIWCKERASNPEFKHKTIKPCSDTWAALPECACVPMSNYLARYAWDKKPPKGVANLRRNAYTHK